MNATKLFLWNFAYFDSKIGMIRGQG